MVEAVGENAVKGAFVEYGVDEGMCRGVAGVGG